MKMIIVIFFLFSIFDILFGDRMKLWQLSTIFIFFLLSLEKDSIQSGTACIKKRKNY